MRSILLLTLLAVVTLRGEPEYPRMGPDIYDTAADGKALVSAALAQAKAEHKHVLVKFGANWCIWCRRLHATLGENPAVQAALAKDYVLVQVDVNQPGPAGTPGARRPRWRREAADHAGQRSLGGREGRTRPGQGGRVPAGMGPEALNLLQSYRGAPAGFSVAGLGSMVKTRPTIFQPSAVLRRE